MINFVKRAKSADYLFLIYLILYFLYEKLISNSCMILHQTGMTMEENTMKERKMEVENNEFMNKDQSIETERVEKEMDQLSPEKKDEILQNFNRFKMYLNSKVEMGEKLGLNEEQLAQAAEKVANYLARNEEPHNREEKMLKELWLCATQEEERQAIARCLVRMVSGDDRVH